MLIDKLEFAAPKTKDMAGDPQDARLRRQVGAGGDRGYDANVYKSGRNIDRVNVAPASDLNAHAVLSAKRLLMTTAALDALKAKARLGQGERTSSKPVAKAATPELAKESSVVEKGKSCHATYQLRRALRSSRTR